MTETLTILLKERRWRDLRPGEHVYAIGLTRIITRCIKVEIAEVNVSKKYIMVYAYPYDIIRIQTFYTGEEYDKARSNGVAST